MSELTDLQEFLSGRLPMLELNGNGNPTVKSSEQQKSWLCKAVSRLKGFSVQPCVIRRTRLQDVCHSEVSRNSEMRFLPAGTAASSSSPVLMLGEDGNLYMRVLDGQRTLRSNPDENITDDIYEYRPVENPAPAQLEQIRKMAVAALYKTGYAEWTELTKKEQKLLVRSEGGSDDAIAALSLLKDGSQAEALELFLGDGASERMRNELWEAGAEGRLPLNGASLAWFLQRADWHAAPAIFQIARSIAADNPEEASKLTRHPNETVRMHLADLPDNSASLLEWLKTESSIPVRQHILMSLQRVTTAADLARTITGGDKDQLQAAGWALAHWQQSFSDSEWELMKEVVKYPIGKANADRLKTKIAQNEAFSA